jgi:hypothetical protein
MLFLLLLKQQLLILILERLDGLLQILFLALACRIPIFPDNIHPFLFPQPRVAVDLDIAEDTLVLALDLGDALLVFLVGFYYCLVLFYL